MARILRDYPAVSLASEVLDGKLDFEHIFGRPGPVHIEIGSGKGTFLVSQARHEPETNFLGIEWASRYYRYAVDRIGRWQLKNVRIIRTDATQFITDFIGDNSVDCFHIYFPDPWPKKRHNKRRFFCSENLEQLLRCLKKNGCIKIATDHAEYFQSMQAVLTKQADKFEKIDFTSTAGAEKNEAVGTNYERKYLRQKKEIYTFALKKK
jgi:tRNA (guanine-N7-)-methyltransferase